MNHIRKLSTTTHSSDRLTSGVHHKLDSLVSCLKPKSIAVALSGGVDSTVLCHLTQTWAKQKKIKMYAFTIDHGVQAGSHKDTQLVHETMKSRGIPHTVIPVSLSSSSEKAMRIARYNALVNQCKQDKIPCILSAHTADDQVETLLMRMAGGSGIEGLSCMSSLHKLSADLSLLRPLLNVHKKELIDYCKSHDLTWIEDPTNTSDVYHRNRIRTALSDIEQTNPSFKDQIEQVRSSWDQVATELIEWTDRYWTERVTQNEKWGYVSTDVKSLLELPDPIICRVLRNMAWWCVPAEDVHKLPVPPSISSIYDILDDIKKPHGLITIGKAIVWLGSGQLSLFPGLPRPNRQKVQDSVRHGRWRVYVDKQGSKQDLFVSDRLTRKRWQPFLSRHDDEWNLPIPLLTSIPVVYDRKARVVGLPTLETTIHGQHKTRAELLPSYLDIYQNVN